MGKLCWCSVEGVAQLSKCNIEGQDKKEDLTLYDCGGSLDVARVWGRIAAFAESEEETGKHETQKEALTATPGNLSISLRAKEL